MTIKAVRASGHYAIVDKEDYDIVRGLLWHYLTGYAYNRGVPMHIHILGYREGYRVWHINNDKLDNRRCNLVHIPNSGLNSIEENVKRVQEICSGREVKDYIPERVVLTPALISQANRDAVTARKKPPKLHRLSVINEEGDAFDSLSDACRWIGTKPHNGNNIIRSIVFGARAYGYRWFLNPDKMSQRDLEKFTSKYRLNKSQVVYPGALE